MTPEVFAQFNVPVPRYTSYPTVLQWDKSVPDTETWCRELRDAYFTGKRELSLYIHLLFCEQLCTYCACNTRITTDHRVERPYIQRLLKEWSMYLDALDETPRIKDLHLGGGTPTFFSAEHLDHLLEAIFSSAQVLPDAVLSFEAHPANTTSEHLEVLFNRGFRRISIGVQDFDVNVQQLINRRQTEAQVKAITNLARLVGYTSINFDLVYGLPGQSAASLTSTMEKVIGLRPDRIAFYGYAHVPGMKPAQKSYEHLLPDKIAKAELYLKGRSMLVQAGYAEVGLDHFALPGDELLIASLTGNLHRSFMGYSDHSTSLLVGIGPSAISDSGTMMVQNAHAAEHWNTAVDAGKLPVTRGHLLTQEDLVLRKHIQNIMCRQETDWVADVEFCKYLNEVHKRLLSFREEGMIQLDLNSVKVLESGRPALRNISNCFDARAAQETENKTVYPES